MQAALRVLGQEAKHSLIVEINSRPYHVAKNDLIQIPYKKNLSVGDIIVLDRIREVTTPNWIVRGNPFIRPDICQVKATVVEHATSNVIVRRHKKRSGDDRMSYNQTKHTLLRIADVQFKQ
ncbi:ribosomal protein L21-like protein [Gorgonomyces haynaldii]|nr:ribosomal protein L21-like protein [Gorgonomyces haynaldii]